MKESFVKLTGLEQSKIFIVSSGQRLKQKRHSNLIGKMTILMYEDNQSVSDVRNYKLGIHRIRNAINHKTGKDLVSELGKAIVYYAKTNGLKSISKDTVWSILKGTTPSALNLGIHNCPYFILYSYFICFDYINSFKGK